MCLHCGWMLLLLMKWLELLVLELLMLPVLMLMLSLLLTLTMMVRMLYLLLWLVVLMLELLYLLLLWLVLLLLLLRLDRQIVHLRRRVVVAAMLRGATCRSSPAGCLKMSSLATDLAEEMTATDVSGVVGFVALVTDYWRTLLLALVAMLLARGT